MVYNKEMKSVIILIVVLLNTALGLVCPKQPNLTMMIIKTESTNYLGGKPTPPVTFTDKGILHQDIIKKMEQHKTTKEKIQDRTTRVKQHETTGERVEDLTIENGVVKFLVVGAQSALNVYKYNYLHSELNCQPHDFCILDLIEYGDFSFIKLTRVVLTIKGGEGNDVIKCQNDIRDLLDRNMTCKILDLDQKYQRFEIMQKKTIKHQIKNSNTTEELLNKKPDQQDPLAEEPPQEEQAEQKSPSVVGHSQMLEREIIIEKHEYFFDTKDRKFKARSPDQEIGGEISRIDIPQTTSDGELPKIQLIIKDKDVILTFDDADSCFYILQYIKKLMDNNKKCPEEKQYNFKFQYLTLNGKFVSQNEHEHATLKSGVLKLSGDVIKVSGNSYTFREIKFAPVWDNYRILILEQVVDSSPSHSSTQPQKYENFVLVNFLKEECVPEILKKKSLRKKK
jgi:hypothetical protein